MRVERHRPERKRRRVRRCELRRGRGGLPASQRGKDVFDRVLAERGTECEHRRTRSTVLDGVAQKSVARGGEELRVGDVEVEPARPSRAVAARALARESILAAVHVASDRTLVERGVRLSVPRSHEGDERVHVRSSERTAALDTPGRHGGSAATIGDRGSQEFVGDRSEKIGTHDPRCSIGLVSSARRPVTNRAHLLVHPRPTPLDQRLLTLVASDRRQSEEHKTKEGVDPHGAGSLAPV